MYYSNNNLNIVYALIVIVIHFSMQYLVHNSFVYEMNATTLNEMSDTYSSFLRFFFIVFLSTLTGLMSGFCVVGQYIYPMYCTRNAASALLENMTSEEGEDDDEAAAAEAEDKEQYMKSYCAAFQALDATRVLSNDELSVLKTKTVNEIVQEKLDNGETLDKEIIMTYNCDTESFWYYTNYATRLSFEILNMVARKFVIEYNCKAVYKGEVFKEKGEVFKEEEEDLTDDDLTEEEEEEEKKTDGDEDEEVTEEEKELTEVPIIPKPIFARFKNYNTDPMPSAQISKAQIAARAESAKATAKAATAQQIEEIPKNQFKYKGKLNDYAASIKGSVDESTITNEANTKIDYAAFKKQYILNKN